VHNSATAQGGGIYNEISQPTVLNTILVGILLPRIHRYMFKWRCYSQIFRYEGGYEGEGNINSDPSFSDTLFILLIGALALAQGIDFPSK